MSVYEAMARDAGATGDEIQQMAQAIEADHRSRFERSLSMSELSPYCLKCGSCGEWECDGRSCKGGEGCLYGQDLIADAQDELATLEQRVERLGEAGNNVRNWLFGFAQMTNSGLAQAACEEWDAALAAQEEEA